MQFFPPVQGDYAMPAAFQEMFRPADSEEKVSFSSLLSAREDDAASSATVVNATPAVEPDPVASQDTPENMSGCAGSHDHAPHDTGAAEGSAVPPENPAAMAEADEEVAAADAAEEDGEDESAEQSALAKLLDMLSSCLDGVADLAAGDPAVQQAVGADVARLRELLARVGGGGDAQAVDEMLRQIGTGLRNIQDRLAALPDQDNATVTMQGRISVALEDMTEVLDTKPVSLAGAAGIAASSTGEVARSITTWMRSETIAQDGEGWSGKAADVVDAQNATAGPEETASDGDTAGGSETARAYRLSESGKEVPAAKTNDRAEDGARQDAGTAAARTATETSTAKTSLSSQTAAEDVDAASEILKAGAETTEAVPTAATRERVGEGVVRQRGPEGPVRPAARTSNEFRAATATNDAGPQLSVETDVNTAAQDDAGEWNTGGKNRGKDKAAQPGSNERAQVMQQSRFEVVSETVSTTDSSDAAASMIRQDGTGVSRTGAGLSRTEAQVRTADVSAQIENGAFRNLGQGTKQLVLRLDPADLGQVNVVLQVRGKEVRAVLRTSTHEAGHALSEQMTQLRTHLENQGLKVAKLEVQTQLADSQTQSQWNSADQHNQQQEFREMAMATQRWRTFGRAESAVAQDVHLTPQRENLSRSGLDIFA